MRKNDVDIFDKLCGQVIGVYDEISLLSKKSPNDAVNKFKLSFINGLISQANDFLDDKYKPFADFSVFDEDTIPQNSDVVFILAQYLQCFEKLRADNLVQRSGTWSWRVLGDEGDVTDERGYILIRTVKPKRLQE